MRGGRVTTLEDAGDGTRMHGAVANGAVRREAAEVRRGAGEVSDVTRSGYPLGDFPES